MKQLLPLLVALAALTPALAPAAVPHPRIWLSDASPLTVKGTGFKAGERVSVTLTAGRRFATRALAANARGALTATWTGAPVRKAGCLAVSIRAVGSRGSVATFKVAGLECASGPASPGP
jgi:hypothetical protein